MKTQLFSPLGRCTVLILGVLGFLASPYRAGAASCSVTAPVPTGATAYVATAPDLVSVLDASANTVACTVTVGTNPGNLAASPDSKMLFVENDGDGTVSVINLATGTVSNTLTITGSAMTASLAVSPDNSKVYVVTLPATFASTQASLYVISLPGMTVSGPTSVVAPSPATATPVTVPGVGVGFTADATEAFIATESLSYTVNTATDSISGTVAVSGGNVGMDPSGKFAYIVDVAPTTSTALNLVDLSSNTIFTANSILPLCAQGNTVAAPPLILVSNEEEFITYYTCQSSHFIQAVDFSIGTPNTAVQHVAVSATAHPMGMFVASDGNSAYVALDDGTVAIVNTSVSPNTLSGTTITLAGAARGIIQRPVQITALTPTTASVPTGTTQQFTSSVNFAFSAGPTPTWAVTGPTATTGSISTAGVYTAPNALPLPINVPANRVVTVSATSSEVPENSLFYPLTSTVTITPSQLVFTTEPPATGTMAGTPLATVAVSVEDAAGNVDTTSVASITITPSSVPPGATLPAPVTVTAVAGVATFTSDLTFTQVGTTPLGTPQYVYTLTAAMTSAPPPMLTPATSTSFTIGSGPATKLVFNTQPTSGTVAGVALNPVVVYVEDAIGNVVTTGIGSNASITMTPTSTPSGITTFTAGSPVLAVNGVATFNALVLTQANIPPSAGFTTVTPYSYTMTATSTVPALTNTGASNSFTIVPAPATKLVYTTPLPTTVTAGIALTPAPIIAVEDTFGNVETTGNVGSTASITMTTNSTPATSPGFVSGSPVSAVNGIATFSNLVIDAANIAPASSLTGVTIYSYTITAASAAPALTLGPSAPPFAVTPAAPKSLVFTTEPASGSTAGLAFVTTPIVVVEDQFGNVETTGNTGSTASITIASSTQTLAQAAAAMTGTLTQAAVNGVAPFPGLILTSANVAPPNTGSTTVNTFNYTLTVTSTGLSNGVSTPTFTINPAAPTKLTYTTPPLGGALVGALTGTTPLNQAQGGVVVAVEDQFGNVETTGNTGSTSAITVGSTNNSNLPAPFTGGGSVSGTLQMSATNGIALFNNLQFLTTGAYSYTLTPTSGTLAPPAVNPAFKLTTNIGVSLTPSVTVTMVGGAAYPASTFVSETSAPNTNPMVVRSQYILTATISNDLTTGSANYKGVTWFVPTAAGILMTNGNAALGTIAAGTCTVAGTSATCTATYTAPSTGALVAGSPFMPTAIPNADTDQFSATSTLIAAVAPSTTSTAPIMVTVFPDLYSPYNPAALPTVANPATINIAAGVASGSTVVNLLGPTSGDTGVTYTFAPVLSTLPANSTMTFSPASISGVVTPGTSATTAVTFTLGISLASMPPSVRIRPSSRPGGGYPGFTLGMVLLSMLLGLVALLRRMGLALPKPGQAFALVFLLIILLGWVSACTQFKQPASPSSPVNSTPTNPGGGFIQVTATPSSSSFKILTINVPYVIQ